MFDQLFDLGVHIEVVGSTQVGKTASVITVVEELIREAKGVTVLVPNKKSYDRLVESCHYHNPRRRVRMANLSDITHIEGINVWPAPPGVDPLVHATENAQTIVKACGAESSDFAPTLERILKMICLHAACANQPLHHSAHLIEGHRKELREIAIMEIPQKYDFIREDLRLLQYMAASKGGFSDFFRQIESARNRMARWVTSEPLRLFTGSKNGSYVSNWIKNRDITFINLEESGQLSGETSKVIGSLIATQFLSAAKQIHEPTEHYLIIDEAQEFMTSDWARLLDLAAKSGLRLVLIHHSPGQFKDKPKIQEALAMHASIKLVFRMDSFKAAKEVAEEIFPSALNRDIEKHRIERTIAKQTELHYQEISRQKAHHHGIGVGGSAGISGDNDIESEHWQEQSGDSTSVSVKEAIRLTPYYERELSSIEYRTREEKIAMAATLITKLERGQCFLKLPAGDAFLLQFPEPERYLQPPKNVLAWKEKNFLKHNALPLHEAQQESQTREAAFLGRSQEYERTRTARPKRKASGPADLAPQEG